MEITETSIIGQEVLDSGADTLIIGISINNSYFKEKNLEQLLMWAHCNAKYVYVMIPDEPAIHTLVACGYTRAKAEKTARLKANALENKCKSIIAQNGIFSVEIIRWNRIVGNMNYLESLVCIADAFKNDSLLKHAISMTTNDVLYTHGIVEPVLETTETGVQFLIKELAFICNADQILNKGRVAYVYHKTMPLLREIIEGKYSFKVSPGVGFITAS